MESSTHATSTPWQAPPRLSAAASSAALAGKKVSEQTKSVLAFALVFPRIEASLFLGMGMGSVFALLKLKPGTAGVMVIHLMQGIFFVCACGIHLHNSKLLGFEVDPNLRVDESTWMPFAIMTGLLAALSWASFFVSSKKVVEVDFVAQAEDVKAQAAAATKLQAGLRAKRCARKTPCGSANPSMQRPNFDQSESSRIMMRIFSVGRCR